MLNPATAPIDNATPELAAAAMADFTDEVREETDLVVADPVRDETADDGGRFGFVLAAGDKTVRVLMPGVPIERVRDDRSTAAPCLKVAGEYWWWPSAVTSAVGALR